MYLVLFFIALLTGLIFINVKEKRSLRKVIWGILLFLCLDFSIGWIIHVSIPKEADEIPSFVLSKSIKPTALNPHYTTFDGAWGEHINGYTRATNGIESYPETDLLICCYGGSSTYCLNLPEASTWPSKLESLLRSNGYKAEVHNHGIAGHSFGDNMSNKEHYSCYHDEYAHIIELHYHGWNDFRSINVPNIEYTNMNQVLEWHSLTNRMMNGLDEIKPRSIAFNYYYMNIISDRAARLITFLENHTLFMHILLGKLHGALHEKMIVENIHKRSLHSDSPRHYSEDVIMEYLKEELRELAKSDKQYIFIPQHFNFELIENKGLSYAYWMPGISEQKAIDYCLELDEFCKQELAPVNYIPLQIEQWQEEDFLDNGHFSEAGCEQFAKMIYDHMHDQVLGSK